MEVRTFCVIFVGFSVTRGQKAAKNVLLIVGKLWGCSFSISFYVNSMFPLPCPWSLSLRLTGLPSDSLTQVPLDRVSIPNRRVRREELTRLTTLVKVPPAQPIQIKMIVTEFRGRGTCHCSELRQWPILAVRNGRFQSSCGSLGWQNPIYRLSFPMSLNLSFY